MKQKKFLFIFSVIFSIILLFYLVYNFPFSNNAFVVANVRPVAANVEGYITDICVTNGEYVKKGHPLFTVFKKPYELAYQKAVADIEEAKAYKITLIQLVKKMRSLLHAKQDMYQKTSFDYERYNQALRDHAVSEVTVRNMLKEKNAILAEVDALAIDLQLNQQKIITQEKKIQSLQAVMENAKVNLDETTVYAKNNGIVQNMFVALGTPIEIRKPIFSFIETESIAIQANMNETELRNVRAGDLVTIFPRIYLGKKRYHGVVVSTNWAASRQITDNRTQQQIVTNNENNWFLLPQRIPVYIHITDYDPVHFPLSVGESAYVNIHT